MTGGRLLSAAVEASAIIRRVEAEGGFAAVLRHGDSERGSILLVIGSRGEHVTCLQRQLELSSGNYYWNPAGPERRSSSTAVQEFLAAQARFDPDMWQIELDIAQPERFIAETSSLG
jgi:hypothetical protein